MDRLLYVAMSGAQHSMLRHGALANNLANVNTTGFKADLQVFRALPVVGGSGERTRTFVTDTTVASDLAPGVLHSTGRDMDIAIEGEGWLAVQDAKGQEAYIRSASLQVDPAGQLVTGSGRPVLGEGGAISVPAEDNSLMIGKDGTLTAIPRTGSAANAVVIGRLKLVNPEARNLVKSPDGLFRQRDGQNAVADETVQVASATLEASNVNAAGTLIGMISAQRQYDLQIKMMQTADQNARQAAQLLTLNA
jgi:flagellar basal-body rod protein FlgF